MITSERQLNAAKKKRVKLQSDIEQARDEGKPEIFLQQANAFGQQIQAEIDEYLDITNNGLDHINVNDINELILMPLKYRLAQHQTLLEFSREIGASERQVARWEKEGYKNISVPQLISIIKRLPITIIGRFAI